MGCDIHSVAQVRRDGKWQTVLTRVCDDLRSYSTFTVLAGVRDYYDSLEGRMGEPRGLPEDFEVVRGKWQDMEHPIVVGTPTDNSWEGGDYLTASTIWMGEHSFSYWSLAELQAYAAKEAVTENFRQIVARLEELAEQCRVGPEDVRYVFGFDS